VIFVTGLDNQDGSTLLPPWSAELNGGVSVQAIDSTAAILTHEVLLSDERAPNLDPHVDVAAPGVDILIQGKPGGTWRDQQLIDGTSLATPIVSGFLAVTAQKYPEATSNQLLQSLIHNTGGDDHELYYDPNQMLGYGVASLTHLLRVDPTAYPDENPLFVPDGEPSAEEVAEAAAADQTPAPTEQPPVTAFVSGFVIFIVAAIVVLALVVLLVILVLRRRRS
jgi:subtilisin family serine protease